MSRHFIPESVIVGRILVMTKNLFLARTVEEIVHREGLAEETASGVLRLDGETVHWVALPKASEGDVLPHSQKAACM